VRRRGNEPRRDEGHKGRGKKREEEEKLRRFGDECDTYAFGTLRER
jgi:hypothetical protein